MFKELVELGRDLDRKGRLPSVGFYYYGQPIRWVLHLWPNKVYLEATDLDKPRPYSGRTSGVEAHLLADEAGYALGVAQDKDGKTDARATKKNVAFRELLKKLRNWEGAQSSELLEAVGWLEAALDAGLVRADPRYGEVMTKDWVSFVPEAGPLAGEHLFEHPEARAFWVTEMQERSAPGEKASKRLLRGECSVCGIREAALIGKIPLGVKLATTGPLHSYNASAFPSFHSGTAPEKTTHLGLCFTCGDSAARAFNYLSSNERHKKALVWDKDKRDSLANQTALFWIRGQQEAHMRVGDSVFDMDELLASVGTVMAEERSEAGTPPPNETQLSALLDLPWRPREAGLTLDDFGFFLGILSPNIGRVAVREWISVSLRALKNNLRQFREATRIVTSWGDAATPQSIARILSAAKIKNPNYNRGLLRTAFLGSRPPVGLLEAAVRMFRNPGVLQDPKEAWRQQALAAAIKLVIAFGQEERMQALDPTQKTQAYLLGRLLAVLERAQLVDTGFSIKTSVVDRYYGAASTAPASVFGNLLRLATTAHLKEAGRAINEVLEEIMGLLDEAGGFKATLTLAEQAEFALGFYHQRAKFRAGHKPNTEEVSA